MEIHKSGLHKDVAVIFGGEPSDGEDQNAESPKGENQNDMVTSEQNEISCQTQVKQAESESAEPAESAQERTPKQIGYVPEIEQIDNEAESTSEFNELLAEDDEKTPKEPTAIEESQIDELLNENDSKEYKGLSAGNDLIEKIKEKLQDYTPKEIATAIAVPICAVIFIVVVGNAFGLFDKKVATEAAPANSGDSIVMVAKNKVVDWEKPALYPKIMRDPTVIGSSITLSAGNLTIKGILFSSDNPSVLIGTQIYREGDKIDDVTIVKINKDSVDFIKGTDKWNQKVK